MTRRQAALTRASAAPTVAVAAGEGLSAVVAGVVVGGAVSRVPELSKPMATPPTANPMIAGFPSGTSDRSAVGDGADGDRVGGRGIDPRESAGHLQVALLVELVILVLYLRAVVAPVVLLACSLLSVAAALGLTTLVFQIFLGDQGLTFYAPFAAAVLLLALGFGADGSLWSVEEPGLLRRWDLASSRQLAEVVLDDRSVLLADPGPDGVAHHLLVFGVLALDVEQVGLERRLHDFAPVRGSRP